MKCIDCAFAMADGLCLGKGGYTLLDADACESFRPRAGAQAKMLKAENAKLRELVRGLDYCSDELNSAECDRCPLHDATDENLEPKCVRMMREMKI